MKIKSFIKKTIHNELFSILSENNSNPFDMRALQKCKTLKEAKFYIEKTLKYMDEGVSRATFELDKDRIIKVALREADVEQNEREVINAKCMTKKYAVEVVDYHPKFWWVIEEKLETLSEEEFGKFFLYQVETDPEGWETEGLEIDWERVFNNPSAAEMTIANAISVAVRGFGSVNRKEFVNRMTVVDRQFSKSQWYVGLIAALKGCKVASDDFHGGNWGIRPSTGEFVLLDLGF